MTEKSDSQPQLPTASPFSFGISAFVLKAQPKPALAPIAKAPVLRPPPGGAPTVNPPKPKPPAPKQKPVTKPAAPSSSKPNAQFHPPAALLKQMEQYKKQMEREEKAYAKQEANVAQERGIASSMTTGLKPPGMTIKPTPPIKSLVDLQAQADDEEDGQIGDRNGDNDDADDNNENNNGIPDDNNAAEDEAAASEELNARLAQLEHQENRWESQKNYSDNNRFAGSGGEDSSSSDVSARTAKRRREADARQRNANQRRRMQIRMSLAGSDEGEQLPAAGNDSDDENSELNEEDDPRNRRRKRRRGSGGGDDSGGGGGDDNGHTKACLAPMMEHFYNTLGRPRPATECWGCKSGRLDSPAICFQKYQRLVTFFKNNLGRMEPTLLAEEMATFFETEIRQEANEHRKPGQSKIPRWKPADIYSHFCFHMKESSVRLYRRLEEIQSIGDALFENALFKRITNADGERVKIPRKKYWKVYKEIVSTERQLMSANPSRMFLYNPTMTMEWGEGKPFTTPHKKNFKLVNSTGYYLK